MEKNLKTISISISLNVVYMEVVLWAVAQGKPILYDQKDVAHALSLRHGLM